MESEKSITIAVTREEKREWKKRAKRDDRSLSAWIRRIVREAVQRAE